MIDAALQLLRDEFASWLAPKDAATIVIDNIGLFETSAGSSLTSNIVISLVNVEQESTLKNQPVQKRPFLNSAIYENAPVYLNLYVLFTCNYSGSDYILALKRLSYVIQFLQSKNVFSSASSVIGSQLNFDTEGIADLKFTMELYTLTFEQINYLWGSLGGRQMPFAMYKMRMVSITERALVREVPLIEEIEIGENKIPGN